ncbi:hypothetical protein TWF718_006422 [Orbilia javanica]|uniref:Uncharacterized protein n=1 Tax=Orbilia javanica TaxID=47235 RepID=A0AAN8N336_9PEZI
MGFLPVSEFQAWLNEPPNPQYLTEITDALDILTTKYFPPDPDYKPGSLPQNLQNILADVNESLASIETANRDYIPNPDVDTRPVQDTIKNIPSPPIKQKEKQTISTKTISNRILKDINTPFTHREDMWNDRPLEKAALTPNHPSVFSALQEFCDYLRTNVDYHNNTTLGVWIYSGYIMPRPKTDVAWYYLDARAPLSQLFGRFYTILSDIYREIERLPGFMYWSLDDPVSKAASLEVLEPLRVYVKRIEQAVYLIYWNLMTMRIDPEKESLLDNMAYNPGLNGKKPRRWPYNVDPRNMGGAGVGGRRR